MTGLRSLRKKMPKDGRGYDLVADDSEEVVRDAGSTTLAVTNGDTREMSDEETSFIDVDNDAYFEDDSSSRGGGGTRLTPLRRLYYQFRRFWISNQPEDWSGESDPRTVWGYLTNILSLLVVAAVVLILPLVLNIVAPRAPIAPGSSADPGSIPNVQSGTVAGVATDHARCSKLGMQMMSQLSGNAADAAVAATLCQGVLHPYSSGLGGSCAILYYDAKARNSTVYDGIATVPANANVANLESKPVPILTFLGLPHSHMHVGATLKRLCRMMNAAAQAERKSGAASGVPGCLKALEDFHNTNGNLDWKDVVKDVAALAESWQVSEHLAAVLEKRKDMILSEPDLAAAFTKEVQQDAFLGDLDSIQEENSTTVMTTLREGDTVSQPELAEFLRSIADSGSSALYEDAADKLSKEISARDGFVKAQDLKSYKMEQRKALETFYSGYKIITAPLPAAGAIVAKTLNILEGFRLRRKGRNGSTYRIVVEALKLVNTDWQALEDPSFNDTMDGIVHTMLDKSRAQADRQTIRKNLAGIDASSAGERQEEDEADEEAPTLQPDAGTQLTVVDNIGNSVSISASIGSEFGARFFSNSTGLLINNDLRVAYDRGLKMKKGSRPLSGMAPVVVEDFGKVQFALGAAGGFSATQAAVEVLLNAVEYGDDIGTSIAAPRLLYDPLADSVALEAVDVDECAITHAFRRSSGAPFSYWGEVCDSLKATGLEVTALDSFGGVQGLSATEEQTEGGSLLRTYYVFCDPRYVGCAAASQ